MRKLKNKPKLIIEIESHKKTKQLTTKSIFDNRTQQNWTLEQIQERGVQCFDNLEDMKETLNWNLNGDSSIYQFKWGQSGKLTTTGYAYIYEKVEGK